MKHTVIIHGENSQKALMAEEGTNLLELLRHNNILLETPCGGKGTCGKCAVRAKGVKDAPLDKEKALLGADRIADGYRLACRTTVNSDLEVYPGENTGVEASIVTGGVRRDTRLVPFLTKQYVELETPSLENQLSDIDRVLSASVPAFSTYDIALLQELPQILRNSGYKVTLLGVDGKLAAVEPGNSADKLYGAAFDIGTTTVAAYLYDLRNGKCLAIGSMLNPQREYGADVISRISFAMQSKDAVNVIKDLIIGCVNQLLDQLTKKSGIKRDDVYTAVFAGNTTMMHLMTGLDASGIAVAPFIPVTTDLLKFSPSSLGIDINKNGSAVVFPGVAAYVGADTIAAILSSGMYESEDISLLVDIGTNGEIVLGCKDWMLSCATAAGPAFEGANIRCGVGGVKGAVDKVGQAPDFQYTTIGSGTPVGICGSGIIDVISVLLDSGLVDETGRLADEEEAEELIPGIGKRIVSIDGMRAFQLVAEGENGAAQVVITQKDIRELQNAKAAIAAGIETLIKRSGKSADEVRKIYLAGGFGSCMSIESALKIGLLPSSFENRITAIGNASGAGASEGLLSKDMLEVSKQIKHKVKYLELSASADFTESYVENMLFPDK